MVTDKITSSGSGTHKTKTNPLTFKIAIMIRMQLRCLEKVEKNKAVIVIRLHKEMTGASSSFSTISQLTLQLSEKNTFKNNAQCVLDIHERN